MAAVIVAAIALMPLCMGESEGDIPYDMDMGRMYSMTVQFVFTGTNAETVEWDFGDGTERSMMENPRHTYAQKGEYIVTQTAWNSYNGGSTAVMKFRIEIMGYPVVGFDSHGGSAVPEIRTTAINMEIQKPADPARLGYGFSGWYTDERCTAPYDWSTLVAESMTLHAGWTKVEGYTLAFDTAGGSMSMDDLPVTTGESIRVPGYEGTRNGFSFGGWSYGDASFEEGDMLTPVSDMKLTAVWVETAPENGSHSIVGYIEDNPAAVAAAMVAIAMATLIAVRIGRS